MQYQGKGLLMIEWKLEKVDLSDVTEHDKNPRELSKSQYKQLKESIDSFGLIDKPVLNTDLRVIGGHQRIKVLEAEGVDSVEAWIPSRKLTDKEVDELCIRLNANAGSWDWDILANAWDEDDLIEWGLENIPDTNVEDVEPQPAAAEEDSIDSICPECGSKLKDRK